MKLKIWILIILSSLAISSGVLYYSNQPPADMGPVVVHHENKPQPLSMTVSQSDLKNWKTYENVDYGYQLSYPQAGRAIDGSDLVAITLDDKSDPIAICAKGNTENLTGEDLFNLWKSGNYKFQTTGMFPEDFPPCIDYPSYAKISTTVLSLANLQMFQVTSMRGSYETVCSYITNKVSAISICLPAEDIKSPTWQEHFNQYNQMLSTFKFTTATSSATTQTPPSQPTQVSVPVGQQEMTSQMAEHQPPPSPVNLTATFDSSAVSLKWIGVDLSSIVEYKVYRYSGNDVLSVKYIGHSVGVNGQKPEPVFSDKYSNAKTSYSYFVTAVDSFGNQSGYSNIVNINIP